MLDVQLVRLHGLRVRLGAQTAIRATRRGIQAVHREGELRDGALQQLDVRHEDRRRRGEQHLPILVHESLAMTWSTASSASISSAAGAAERRAHRAKSEDTLDVRHEDRLEQRKKVFGKNKHEHYGGKSHA